MLEGAAPVKERNLLCTNSPCDSMDMAKKCSSRQTIECNHMMLAPTYDKVQLQDQRSECFC